MPCGQAAQQQGEGPQRAGGAGDQRGWLPGDAHGADTGLGGGAEGEAGDHRMQVEMLVGVEVVAGQAGGAEGGQLRGDLGPQLGAGGG